MTTAQMLLGRFTAAWLVLAATAAGAEPLTLDRLLKTETLGSTALSPDGRRVVIETRAPYDTAPGYDTDNTDPRLGRLMIADLSTTAPAKPLLAGEAGAGYTAGPFSPDGRRMVVSRWQAYRWEAGVVDLDSGAVRWLGFGLELASYGRSLQWLSNTSFVAIATDPDDPPLKLKLVWQNEKRLQALWAQQAAGQVASINVIGSGRARRAEPRSDRRLLRVDLTTGSKAVLATGGFFDLELSPSGDYVAVLGEAERVGLAETSAVRMMAPMRRRDLLIVDLRTGATSNPCSRCTTLIEPMAWSPDADRLLVFQHPVDTLETAGQLMMIDAPSGKAQAVGAGLALDFDYGGEGAARVRADWLGAHPIVRGRVDGADRSDWYDIGGPAPLNLTRGLPATPSSLAIDHGRALLALVGGQAWRVAADGAAEPLGVEASAFVRTSAFGLGLRPRSAPLRTDHPMLRGKAGLIDLAGHRQSLPDEATPLALVDGGAVVAFDPPNGVEAVAVLDRRGRRRDLVRLNVDLAQLDLGTVRTVEAAASNGQVLKSWLYLPPSWRMGDKPPALIVIPYPGSAPQDLPGRFSLAINNLTPNGPLLAAQGYAVLVPAMPHDRSLGEPAQGIAEDILRVVDVVVAQGLADPDRLALWGHSWGGYAGLVTATQTHRFKAIVAQAGAADFASGWAAADPYFITAPEDGGPSPFALAFNETGQGGVKGPPWRETERYRRNSPFFQADKITTPLMLIYGDQDFVTLAQGQAMFSALYRQDKDATLMTLFGERHLPASPANLRAIYAHVLPWLADRLGSPSPPAASEARRPSQ